MVDIGVGGTLGMSGITHSTPLTSASLIPLTEHWRNCMSFSVRVPVLSVNRYSTWQNNQSTSQWLVRLQHFRENCMFSTIQKHPFLSWTGYFQPAALSAQPVRSWCVCNQLILGVVQRKATFFLWDWSGLPVQVLRWDRRYSLWHVHWLTGRTFRCPTQRKLSQKTSEVLKLKRTKCCRYWQLLQLKLIFKRKVAKMMCFLKVQNTCPEKAGSVSKLPNLDVLSGVRTSDFLLWMIYIQE